MASTSTNTLTNIPYEESEESEGSGSDMEVSAEEYETESEEEELDCNPTWAPATSGLREFPFTGDNKLLCDIPGQNKPIDWFWLMLDIVLLEKIVDHTNKNAREFFLDPNCNLTLESTNGRI